MKLLQLFTIVLLLNIALACRKLRLITECKREASGCMPKYQNDHDYKDFKSWEVYTAYDEYGNYIGPKNDSNIVIDLSAHLDLKPLPTSDVANSHTVSHTVDKKTCEIVQPKNFKCEDALCELTQDCNPNGDKGKARVCQMVYGQYNKQCKSSPPQANFKALCSAGNSVSADDLLCYQLAAAKCVGSKCKYIIGLEHEIVNGNVFGVKRVIEKEITLRQCNEKAIVHCKPILAQSNIDYYSRCNPHMSRECTYRKGSECQKLQEFKYNSQCEYKCTDFNKMEECWTFRQDSGINNDKKDKYGCKKFVPNGCTTKEKLAYICYNYKWGEKCSQLRDGASLVKLCNYRMPKICLEDNPPTNCQEIWGPKSKGLERLNGKSSSDTTMILLCVGLVLAVILLSLCMACVCCLIVRSQKQYIVEKAEYTTAPDGTASRRQGDVTIAETLRSTVQMVRAPPNTASRGGNDVSRGGSAAHSETSVRRR